MKTGNSSKVSGEWMDKKEAADWLGVSISTVEAMMRRRKLPYYKLSERMVRFKKTDISDHFNKKLIVAAV